MGTIQHHVIVCTSWKEEHIKEAYDKALNIFPIHLVSDLSEETINGYRSFCIFPDGSKEGWPDSDSMDAKRDMFIKKLKEQDNFYVNFVEITYGEIEYKIVSHR